jgi:hypothetical protein
MSDGAVRLFSDGALSADDLFGDALLSAAFFFATFLGAVFDFGKAPNRFGTGHKISSQSVAFRRGLLCASGSNAMRPDRGLLLSAFVWSSCLIASVACRSAPTPVESPVPVAPELGRKATPAEEISLIRADSEVFAAVVRAQLAAGTNRYPLHIDELRYDPRPYGTRSGYPEQFAGVQGAAPELSFARAEKSAIDRIAENRKRILEMNGVPEGSPFNYPQCGGVRVPPPPPLRGSSAAARAKKIDVHAGCPKRRESYVTVGLPLRGQPPGLKNVRDTRGRLVNLSGDVWSTLVDEHLVGPAGWTWSQYAWLFKRSRWSGRLELAATIPTGIVE